MLFVLIVVVSAVSYIICKFDEADDYRIPYEVEVKESYYVRCSCGKLEQHQCEICNGEGRVLVDVKVEKKKLN